MGGKPTDEYSRIETGPRGPAFQVGDIEGFPQPAAVCPQMEDSDLWPCPEDTAFVYGLPADEDWPAEQGPSGLDYAWQSAKKRTAADRAKAQQDVARAGAFFGKVAAGPDEGWPDLPRPNPSTWLTTLKTRHEGGRSDEYVYFCP